MDKSEEKKVVKWEREMRDCAQNLSKNKFDSGKAVWGIVVLRKAQIEIPIKTINKETNPA